MKNKTLMLIIFISIVAIIFIRPKLSEKQVISSRCNGDNNIWVKETCYEYGEFQHADICRIDGQNTLWESYCSNDRCVLDIVDCSIYDAICTKGRCVKR